VTQSYITIFRKLNHFMILYVFSAMHWIQLFILLYFFARIPIIVHSRFCAPNLVFDSDKWETCHSSRTLLSNILTIILFLKMSLIDLLLCMK
jgi:hypothetical protein